MPSDQPTPACCPACAEISEQVDLGPHHAHITDYGYVLYDPEHQQDLQHGLVALGRREATEGWQREWGVRYPDGYVYDDVTEAAARDIVARWPHRVVISRAVGPWKPADQPDPLAGDPVAQRLGLVDADGRTLCRCLVGAPDCMHRPAPTVNAELTDAAEQDEDGTR